MGTRDFRASARGERHWTLLVAVFVGLLATVAATVLFGGFGAGGAVLRDGDLCPVDGTAIVGSAMFLVDFRKPVDMAGGVAPGELLRLAVGEVAANTELKIFALASSPSAPRLALGRLCRPYDHADLQVEGAKDQRGAARDCDDLPAQIRPDLRDTARQFCGRRVQLEEMLNRLARQQDGPGQPVQDAYLVEAFEDTRLEIASAQGERVLYVFSDMMQHADWYSHLDLGPSDWRYGAFDETLRTRDWPPSPSGVGLRVEVFYVPREGLTDQPRAKRKHQDFWRRYFGTATVSYRETPTMRRYASTPRMATAATDADAGTRRTADPAAGEQARAGDTEGVLDVGQALETQRQAERLRAQVENERQTLAREQQALATTRRTLTETEQRLDRERRTLETTRQKMAEEAARSAASARDVAEAAPPELAARPPPAEPPDAAAASNAAPVPATADLPRIEPLPPCGLMVPVGGANDVPGYPQRFGLRNFGNAAVTVRYVVTPGGRTDAIVVERASAAMERYRVFFEEVAVEAVRGWTFSFEDPGDGTCGRQQERTSTFQFEY